MTDDDQAFEDYPLRRTEYISALVHLYRGELGRANIWRMRLDTTTNWAIITSMGLLSFAFNRHDNSHAILLVGMLMILTFLTVEARRYRLFDVWHNRVRIIEENFYGPILRRDLESRRGNWGNLIADDLLRPRFKITYMQAFRSRLIRNYVPLFGLVLLAWIVKITITPSQPPAWNGFVQGCSIGPIPGWEILSGVAALYGFLLGVVLFVKKPPETEFWHHSAELKEHF